MLSLRKSLGLEPKLLIRLDDIAPNMKWDYFEKIKKVFDKYEIKPVIGVIPKNKDLSLKKYPKCNFNFWEKIKQLQNEGWEISMHGYEHSYSDNCKNDYCNYGGNTEFAGFDYENQLEKIKLGLDIFKNNNISIKSFFAPNHTFDMNTIKACKEVGIETIIDGYGLKPYIENDMVFLPQLFHKLFFLPFGFQTIQIHLNYYDDKNFLFFSNFIEINHKKITNFDYAKKISSNNFWYKMINFKIKFFLVNLRRIIKIFRIKT